MKTHPDDAAYPGGTGVGVFNGFSKREAMAMNFMAAMLTNPELARDGKKAHLAVRATDNLINALNGDSTNSAPEPAEAPVVVTTPEKSTPKAGIKAPQLM